MAEPTSELRELARTLDRIDVDVYAQHGRDPLDPIIGGGPANAPFAIIGRDPGRTEVEHGFPFVGAGGQLVRQGLGRAFWGREPKDFDESLQVGQQVFWTNTVPYKPIGNKAWKVSEVKRFQPVMLRYLLSDFQGSDLVALGRVAFYWTAIGQPRAVREQLDAHWARDDRYETSLEVTVAHPQAGTRTLRVHPLPHPSPLNATWYKRFPELLDGCLSRLGITPE